MRVALYEKTILRLRDQLELLDASGRTTLARARGAPFDPLGALALRPSGHTAWICEAPPPEGPRGWIGRAQRIDLRTQTIESFDFDLVDAAYADDHVVAAVRDGERFRLVELDDASPTTWRDVELPPATPIAWPFASPYLFGQYTSEDGSLLGVRMTSTSWGVVVAQQNGHVAVRRPGGRWTAWRVPYAYQGWICGFCARDGVVITSLHNGRMGDVVWLDYDGVCQDKFDDHHAISPCVPCGDAYILGIDDELVRMAGHPIQIVERCTIAGRAVDADVSYDGSSAIVDFGERVAVSAANTRRVDVRVRDGSYRRETLAATGQTNGAPVVSAMSAEVVPGRDARAASGTREEGAHADLDRAVAEARWVYTRGHEPFRVSDVERLEREIAASLPADYRAAVEAYGGIDFVQHELRAPGGETLVLRGLFALHRVEAIVHDTRGDVLAELRSGDTEEPDPASDEDEETDRERFCWLRIAESGTEGAILLAIGGPAHGWVVHEDRVRVVIERRASTFAAFWSGLVVHPASKDTPARKALADCSAFGVLGVEAAISRSRVYWRAVAEVAAPGQLERRRAVHAVLTEHFGPGMPSPEPFPGGPAHDALAHLAHQSSQRKDVTSRSMIDHTLGALLRITQTSEDKAKMRAIARALMEMPVLDERGLPVAPAPAPAEPPPPAPGEAPAPRPRRVRHPKFGVGTVVAERDGKLEIQFDDHGGKKLAAQFVTEEPG